MKKFQPLENGKLANFENHRPTTFPPFLKKNSLVGLFALLFLVYFCLLNFHRKTAVCSGERRTSEEGEYSYVAPEDWIDKGSLGGGVFIVNPEIENGIDANILIAAYNTESKESRDKISDQILSGHEDVKLLMPEKIKTDIGAEGTVIYSVWTNSLGVAISRSHYILPHHSGVVVVAGTCAALCKDKYEPVFFDVAKSVRDE
jgi:hypothetical protein